jgi:hypothetical protein
MVITDIKSIIKEHYDQLYAHKSDKPDEMKPLLERHNLLESCKNKQTIRIGP